MSTTRWGGWGSETSAAAAKAAAWVIWGPTSPGPRKPKSRLFTKTASTSSSGVEAIYGSARGGKHHVPAGIFALGTGGHALDLVDGVMDDLAVGW